MRTEHPCVRSRTFVRVRSQRSGLLCDIRELGCAARAVWLATLLGSPFAMAQQPAICLVIAEDSAPHREAADAVTAELAGRAALTRVVALADASLTGCQPNAQAIVALGTRALTQTLLRYDMTPIVAGLVPRGAYERAIRGSNRPTETRSLTAVFLDQPPGRQLNLIRAVVPDRTRVGVLTGADAADEIPLLRDAARERRLTIASESVGDAAALYPALKRLLDGADVILAVPDARVYNAGTIHNIIASSVRAQMPLFGFSPAYVRAGAIAAVYSTPRQIGQQTGELTRRALSANQLPPPQYPRGFAVSTNATVARSLGITIDDEPTLTAKLIRMERE